MEENIQNLSPDNQNDQIGGVDAYCKNYKLLVQLSEEHQSLLSSYDRRYKQIREQHQIMLLSVNKLIFPTLTKHIHQIVDPQVVFKKETYSVIIQQLLDCINIEIINIFQNLTLQQKRFYQQVILENRAILELSKRFNKTDRFEWTAQKMFKLDILSIFLMINLDYRKKHQMPNAPIPPRLLRYIFKINKRQLDEYILRFQQNQAVLSQRYKKQFEQIVLLLTIIELKKKVSNFKRKYGTIKTRQIIISQQRDDLSQVDKDTQLGQQSYFDSRSKYRYRFSEIAYIPVGQKANKSIDQLNKPCQTYVEIALKQISIQTCLIKKKRQLLKLKSRYSISFLSLFMSLEDSKILQNTSNNVLCKRQNIEQCQWIFLKNIHLVQALQDIAKSKINYKSLFRNNNVYMARLCQITVNRFILLTKVLKAHEKIEAALDKQNIYICKFQYSFQQFQREEAQTNTENLIFTFVLATSASKFVFTALFHKKIDDRQFGEVIKETFPNIKSDKTNVVIYNFDYKQYYVFKELKKLFALRIHKNVRIYFATSPQYFYVHFLIYYLIESFIKIKKISKKTFFQIVEDEIVQVFQAFNSAKTVRQCLFSLSPQKIEYMINYRNFFIPFNEGEIRQRIQGILRQQISFFRLRSDIYLWPNPQKLSRGYVYYFKDIDESPTDYLQQTQTIDSFDSLLTNKRQFIDKFVEQLRWRHPFIQQPQHQLIFQNLHHFMKRRRLQLNDLKRMLKYVVRFLICYQAYFNLLLIQNKFGQKAILMEEQIQFLRQIYAQENERMDKLYPYGKQQAAKEFFSIQLTNGQRLKLDFQKYKVREIDEQYAIVID